MSIPVIELRLTRYILAAATLHEGGMGSCSGGVLIVEWMLREGVDLIGWQGHM